MRELTRNHSTRAIVWALTGDTQKARSALAKVSNEEPLNTVLNQGELPAVEAMIDVQTGHPKDQSALSNPVAPSTSTTPRT